MGSWYGTCGVSQLPIVEGDEVALFILLKNGFTQRMAKTEEIGGGGLVHSDSLYQPICLPIFGTYADYGVIDNIEDLGNTVSNQLKSLDFIINIEEKVTRKEKYKFDNLTDFIKKIERNKIEYYGFMMVHKGLFDVLVSYIKPLTNYYTDDKSLGDYLKNDAKELLKIIKDNNLRVHDFISKDLKEYKFIGDKRVLGNKFKWATENYLTYYRNPDIYENNSQLLDNMIDFLLFIEIMECSRKLWIPQAGSGSQDREYDVAELIGEFAKEKQKEAEE